MLLSVLRAGLPSLVVTAAVLGWLLRTRAWPSVGLGLAWAAGVIVGSWANTPLVPLLPRFHWHWLPILSVAATVILVWVALRVASVAWQWASVATVAVLVAWRVVPSWPEMTPYWRTTVLLAGYLLVVCAGWWTVTRRTSIPELAAYLSLTQAALVVSTAVAVSITFAQLGCLMLGASLSMTGGLGIAAARGQLASWRTFPWVVPVALTLGVSAFVSAVEPLPPDWAFLAIPLAPALAPALAGATETLWPNAPANRRLAIRVLLVNITLLASVSAICS